MQKNATNHIYNQGKNYKKIWFTGAKKPAFTTGFLLKNNFFEL